MIIFHNKQTEKHNPIREGEGSYRVENFIETVSDTQIKDLIPLVEAEINFTHSSRHKQKMKGACKSKCRVAEVFLAPDSYNAMLTSVALAIMAADQNAFAITRPPGHHAIKEGAQGLCFFNNIAVATSYLVRQGKRVCIVDIDGHHGNGTQAIFKKNENVFYCSMHQEYVYPYSSGLVSDIGFGHSFKKAINIPLRAGSGDDIFISSLEFFIGYIKEFNPDYIAVSAGFDGYIKDTVLELKYSKNGYYQVGKLLSSLNLPTFAVLEGGYHNEVKECVQSFVSGFSGDEFPFLDAFSTSPIECKNKHLATMGILARLLG